MPNPTSTPKQPDKAASPHAGWLTRAQVAAELGYRSIFPIRKMEGGELRPVRDPRGWLFDPAEVAALKAKRPIGSAGAPVSRGASPPASSISSTRAASCARSSRSWRSRPASSAISGTNG